MYGACVRPSVRLAAGLARAGDGVVAVAGQVRVVDAGDGDELALDLDLAAGVGHVQPAAFGERRAQILPRQRLAGDAVRRLEDVVRRVLRLRTEVVVAAEDEQARHRQQVAQRLHHRRHGLRVGQVVTGVDDEVGLQPGELAHPRLLAALAGRHVEVAEVQHAQRRGARRQHRHRRLPHHERVAFDQRGVGDPGGQRTGGQRAGQGGGILQNRRTGEHETQPTATSPRSPRLQRASSTPLRGLRRWRRRWRTQHRHRDRRQAGDHHDRRPDRGGNRVRIVRVERRQPRRRRRRRRRDAVADLDRDDRARARSDPTATCRRPRPPASCC